ERVRRNFGIQLTPACENLSGVRCRDCGLKYKTSARREISARNPNEYFRFQLWSHFSFQRFSVSAFVFASSLNASASTANPSRTASSVIVSGGAIFTVWPHAPTGEKNNRPL